MKKALRSDEQLALQDMLRQARRDARLTQEALAFRLGKPQSFIAKYEAGERLLNVIELIYILQELNRSPSDFVLELTSRIAPRT